MATQLQVAVTESVACIRVEGPANFAVSVDLNRATQCCDAGGRVLHSISQRARIWTARFSEFWSGLRGNWTVLSCSICEQVTDLLENLGVLDLMSVGQGANPFDDRLEAHAARRTSAR